MPIQKSIQIARECNDWRTEKPPYDGDTPETHRPMPYAPAQFTEAIDTLIRFAELKMENGKWKAGQPESESPEELSTFNSQLSTPRSG